MAVLDPRLGIGLQTAARWDIPNRQGTEITRWDAADFRKLEIGYPLAQPRTNPTPRYNCHGLTFAARRTMVDDSLAIQRILSDDSYAELGLAHVLPGDVILYFADNGDVQHSGVVVTAPSPVTFGVPMVVSKWGQYKELLHLASQCPYRFAGARYYRVRA